MKGTTWQGLPKAGNPYPGAFSEGKLPGKAFQELEILILVHFMKENYLARPSPYPGAFYEGELPGKAFHGAFYERELPGKAFQELEIRILVHFLKENYLARPSKSWKSLSWCIL